MDRLTEAKETKQQEESSENTLPRLFPTFWRWSDIIIPHTHLSSYIRIGRQASLERDWIVRQWDRVIIVSVIP